jgi:predicted amidophosphoribosyltransferase
MSNPILTVYFCCNCGVALSPDRGDLVCEACFQELANEAAEALEELADPPDPRGPRRRDL